MGNPYSLIFGKEPAQLVSRAAGSFQRPSARWRTNQCGKRAEIAFGERELLAVCEFERGEVLELHALLGVPAEV